MLRIGVLRFCIIFSISGSSRECFVNLSISLRSGFAPSVRGVLVSLKMGGGLFVVLVFLLLRFLRAFSIRCSRVSGIRCVFIFSGLCPLLMRWVLRFFM